MLHTPDRRNSKRQATSYEQVEDRICIPECTVGSQISNASAGEVKDDTYDDLELWIAVAPAAIASLGRLDREYEFGTMAARSSDGLAAPTREGGKFRFQVDGGV